MPLEVVLTEFSYVVKISHRDWTPAVSQWLRENIGRDSFQYHKGSDNYSYLGYGFRNEEDAIAFKIKFG